MFQFFQIATCSECQRYTPLKTQAPLMYPIKVKEPWELIVVDMIGENQFDAVICFTHCSKNLECNQL